MVLSRNFKPLCFFFLTSPYFINFKRSKNSKNNSRLLRIICWQSYWTVQAQGLTRKGAVGQKRPASEHAKAATTDPSAHRPNWKRKKKTEEEFAFAPPLPPPRVTGEESWDQATASGKGHGRRRRGALPGRRRGGHGGRRRRRPLLPAPSPGLRTAAPAAALLPVCAHPESSL